VKFAAWCSLSIGILMLAQWSFFIAAGQVPELRTEPIRIAFHLVAEGATALALIVAGFSLLRGRPWARVLGLVANGMLVYTVIVSPGYFAQSGQWPLVGMFGLLLVLAAISIVQLSRGLVNAPSSGEQ
jgi:hypothetical protein